MGRCLIIDSWEISAHFGAIKIYGFRENIVLWQKDTLTRSWWNILKWSEMSDIKLCSNLPEAVWALAHLFMLHAIALQATAKQTLAARRTRSLPSPWDRFSSELVASIPERILYRSFHSVVCWMAYIWSRSLISGVISRRKSPTVSRGLHPLLRWFGALTGHLSSRLHWRQVSPSNIAWSDFPFLLLWLSILWSVGLWPMGHLVAKPPFVRWPTRISPTFRWKH